MFQRFISSTNKRPTTSSPALIIYCSRVLNHNWWLIKSMTHFVWVITMSHWKKKIYENLDFRHFWWFLRLLLHSAQSFISSSWYESLLWVISDRIHLRITYAGHSSSANHRLPINPHIMPIIQSSSVRASLTPSWHLRVGAREQHMMTHQLWVININDELQQPIRRKKPAKYPNILICKYLCKLDL